ncbi:gamma-glutamyltransferase [Neisseriaceae bacterium TC5R-5]|nr:gamma-glutamyltransferase [Neisseriaceae bacterium TC5R-5]
MSIHQLRRSFALSVMALSLAALGSVAAASVTSSAVKYDYEQSIFQPVAGRQGMVASEQELASRVGVEILKQGGNAVDAAVAVGFALAVVLPNAGNLGGGGFMLLHDAKSGDNIALDFRELAPAKASRDMYLDAQGKVVDGRSLHTHLAVGVPGTVAGLEHALQRWGSLPLSKVVAPAIKLAEEGFVISPTLGKALSVEQDHLGQWDSSRAVFFKNGQVLAAGNKLVQPDLAKSLRLIAAQGAKVFYQGEIGDKIVAEMAQHGGLITQSDLQNYRVIERQPVTGSYRGYQVVSMPPPSSGGIHIIEMLNLLERYPLAQYGPNSAQTIHYLAAAMQLAYADRAEYLGDPAFVKVPQSGLISKAYADELAKKIDPVKVVASAQVKPGQPLPYESDQTTHYSIVDKQGNAVAVTYTLNLNFGSGIVAKGTGILLNNEMDDFSVKPGVPNAFGLVGGDANAVEAGKRPLSSMSPTLVLKDNQPWLVTGSPGGARIITATLQTIVNAIDFDMNPAEAAASPRVHHQWLPDELRVEKGISPDTTRLLREQGYKVVQKPTMGRTQTIQLRDGVLLGYSDPRNPDGATLAY